MVNESPTLSIVTCVKGDHCAFINTLTSLKALPGDFFDVVVSDSSSNPEATRSAIAEVALAAPVTYLWSAPRGIYPGINRGITEAKGRWIQVLHSGDLLLPHRLVELVDALRTSRADALIFHTVFIRDGKYVYFQKVHEGSLVWPHQATFLRSYVHRKLGLYDENYRFASDQVFLRLVRNRFKCLVKEPIVVAFDCSGVSSSGKFAVMKEASELYKLYGKNWLSRFLHVYAFQFARRILNDFVSPSIMDSYHRLKNEKVPDYLIESDRKR